MATDLTAYLGHSIAQCSPPEIVTLRGIYGAIRDGEASWQSVMQDKVEQAPAKTLPACTPESFEKSKAGWKKTVEKGIKTVNDLIATIQTKELLTDEQRMTGVERLVAAGLPVVVGTGAQNPKRAAALAAHARAVGAQGLMLIPRVLSRGASMAAQRAHFDEVLAAGEGLPSVIYNSPHYGFETRADLFFALRAEHPNLVGFKEFGGAEPMSYAAEYITSRDDEVTLMVGVDTVVVHGFVNCGATGAITGIGSRCWRAPMPASRRC